MLQWRGPAGPADDWAPCVVTIGMFDGVHRGHQRIFSRIRQETSGHSLPVVLVTFDPHPDEVIGPGSHAPILCSARHESQLLAEQGVTAVWTIPFTLEFSRLGADEFVRGVLVKRLHAAQVVVGENFRFGHKGAGNLALLETLADTYNYKAVGVPLLANAGKPISSTSIRAKLAAGDVLDAAHDLGRPHRVEGAAVRGNQRSPILDFPNAKMEPAPDIAVPEDGVYAGWLTDCDSSGRAEVDRRQAVISVGTDPAAERHRRIIEAYLLDHDHPDMCGEHLAVDFVRRLRAPMPFSSIDGLVPQIRKDAADARRFLRRSMTTR